MLGVDFINTTAGNNKHGRNEERSFRSRWLSAIELLFGTAIVIGHNVFQAVPNEVPILFVLGLVSINLLNGRNLWTSILAHGFIDTFGVIVLYFGLDS